jgi:hypothetical protein
MNKLTLILPDIHHRIDIADKIIRAVGADVVICLGDYFDSFDETPQMVFETASWLTDFVKKDNHIAITGNHDIQYAYANRYFQCSGYAQWKYYHINDTVKSDTWDKLKHYHILDDMWLLTHAGLHSYFIPKQIRDLVTDRPKMFVELSKFLDSEIVKGMRNESWVFHAGHIRGGDQLYGGINWCDSREFVPLKGLHQIIGHTVFDKIRWKNICDNQNELKTDYKWSPSFEKLNDLENSYNVCIDTGASHYATWNGTNMNIYWLGDS